MLLFAREFYIYYRNIIEKFFYLLSIENDY